MVQYNIRLSVFFFYCLLVYVSSSLNSICFLGVFLVVVFGTSNLPWPDYISFTTFFFDSRLLRYVPFVRTVITPVRVYLCSIPSYKNDLDETFLTISLRKPNFTLSVVCSLDNFLIFGSKVDLNQNFLFNPNLFILFTLWPSHLFKEVYYVCFYINLTYSNS